MKITKENVIIAVQNSVSSIFSKEDVINLINSIEEGSSRKITTEDIEIAIDKVISWADNNESDVVDFDSVEFELSYNNRIEVTNVPIQLENLREALENNFMDFGEDEDLVELERVSSSEFVSVDDEIDD